MSAEPVGLNGTHLATFRAANDGHPTTQFRDHAYFGDETNTLQIGIHTRVSITVANDLRVPSGTH